MSSEVHEVEFTDEFGSWWDRELTGDEQRKIDAIVGLLEARGTTLGYPHSSDVRTSEFGEMRELRVQHAGDPIRILYAFDPRQVAMLLIGDNKAGQDKEWYEKHVPIADRIFREHLEELKKTK